MENARRNLLKEESGGVDCTVRKKLLKEESAGVDCTENMCDAIAEVQRG